MPRKPATNPVFTEAITQDYQRFTDIAEIHAVYKSLNAVSKRAMDMADTDGHIYFAGLMCNEYRDCFLTKKGQLIVYPKKYLMHTDKRVRLAALSWMQGKSVWNTGILFDRDHEKYMVDTRAWFIEHRKFQALVDISQAIKYGDKLYRDAIKALSNAGS